MNRIFYVYRFFGDHRELLYIGSTSWLDSRMIAHRKIQPWWDEVKDIRLEMHPDEATARMAEATAISAEAPRYNVVHNQLRNRPPKWRPLNGGPKLPRWRWPYTAKVFLDAVEKLGDEATTETVAREIDLDEQRTSLRLMQLAGSGWLHDAGGCWTLPRACARVEDLDARRSDLQDEAV